MQKNKRQSIKKIGSKVLTLVCLGVFIFAAHGLFDTFMDYYQNRKVLNSAQDTFYNAVAAEENQREETREPGEIRPGFKELLKQNEDVVGWLTIDGTQIDYPILQSSNNQTYLNTGYDEKEALGGSIFLDYRNDISAEQPNTVIYGHRMKDGSMFQHLTKYMDQEFLDSHPTFEFDTLYDSYEAEIFAVYNTLTNFNYIETDFENKDVYAQLLKDIKNEAKYKRDVNVSADDRIITLSTCDYELDDNEGRLVVQAKLIKK